MTSRRFGVTSFLFVSSILQGCCAGELGEDPSEMIFRIEAGKTADGGYRVLTVFEVLDGHVYPDRIDELYGGLSKLLFEKMNCRPRETAVHFLCLIPDN